MPTEVNLCKVQNVAQFRTNRTETEAKALHTFLFYKQFLVNKISKRYFISKAQKHAYDNDKEMTTKKVIRMRNLCATKWTQNIV